MAQRFWMGKRMTKFLHIKKIHSEVLEENLEENLVCCNFFFCWYKPDFNDFDTCTSLTPILILTLFWISKHDKHLQRKGVTDAFPAWTWTQFCIYNQFHVIFKATNLNVNNEGKNISISQIWHHNEYCTYIKSSIIFLHTKYRISIVRL